MSGSSWSAWAGARNGRWDEPENATKSRSTTGRRGGGRPLKKSAPGRAHPGLHRRKRSEPATASLSHLGAARTDAGPAVQLQLEEPVGSGWTHGVELLLSRLCRCGEERAGAGLFAGLGPPPPPAAAGGLGPSASASQPTRARLHCQLAGLDRHGLPAALRAGIEPGRIHLGLLEAARVAERLSPRLRATDRNGATNAPSHASPSASDHRLLAAGFFVVRMTLYYARLSKSG